jgi:putative endonuclease
MPDSKTKYYVYVLQSLKDQKYYYGLTTTLESRLKDHNAGRVISTQPRRPLELVYFEELFGYTNARKREKYFKSSAGRKYIKQKLLSSKVSGSPPA